MEKYFNQYTVAFAIGLLGCVVYTIFAAIRYGFQNVPEKDVIIIFADILAICSALKIIYLAFDSTICPPESKVDLMFLGLGGVMMLLVSIKNVVSKFRPGNNLENCTKGNISHK